MQIEIERAKLEITNDEAQLLYSALRTALRFTIVTHWRNHKECWPDREQVRLRILRDLARLSYANDYKAEFEELTELVHNDKPI